MNGVAAILDFFKIGLPKMVVVNFIKYKYQT